MKQRATRMADIASRMNELWPRVLQGNVVVREDYPNAKIGLVRLDGQKLSFILEVECVDGALWGHLSIRPIQDRLPTWKELKWCKEYFLGDRKAIQILPPRAEYVNINPFVLHLYAPLEVDPLPDFRAWDDSQGQMAI